MRLTGAPPLPLCKLSPFQLGAEPRQLLGRQCRLDAWEQDTLLVADVRLEPPSELPERLERGLPVRLQVGAAAAQVHVVREYADDRLLGGWGVPRVGRQQDLLLDPEVAPAVAVPELQELLLRVAGSLAVGAL